MIYEAAFTPIDDVVFRAFSDGETSISIVDQAGVISREWQSTGQEIIHLRDGRIALFNRVWRGEIWRINLILLTPDLPE